MLSAEENALLTRVEGNAPAGQMFRRYWLPACLSEELPENDSNPVRLRILGENLVAFRDSRGRVGIIEEACPHRLASLALGRNEEGGIRCIYHGWKFDVDGHCMEMPTEPEDSTFKNRLRARAYRVHEAGDMVWIYMGPPEHEPPFVNFDFITAPSEQRGIIKVGEYANYLQAVEGAIDSSHSWFLHRGATRDWNKRSEISSDLSPFLQAEDTAYGFRYAAIRKPNADPEGSRYVRVTNFIMPSTALIPRTIDLSVATHVQIFVPVDNERTMFYGLYVSQDGSAVSSEKSREVMRVRPGVELDKRWFKLDSIDNNFNQDREAMKRGDLWTGIAGIPNQDMACQESMGAIVDRTREHLGTSDVAIIRMRRRMLESIRGFMDGATPIGLDTSVPFDRVRSEQKVIPVDQPWQTVGAFAGEYEPIAVK